ncbi:putative glucose-6-phosphate 1-epimerase [Prosopis cineraria]|uniref:putative glucose-6-phosphate 1-epimerase n=1 Tax=Prosopis cineraria TaxID=364024 RepID=UPI0024104EDA|nr:putative glucose-6-phosphate 1-epimerase [Prosopis cineraria]
MRARLRPRPMPLNMFQDSDELSRIILTEPTGSSADVLLYGGQIVSWKNEKNEELLFKSSKANLKQPKAIRGGISVCFPQFGNMSSLDQQGFARSRLWSLDRDPSPLPPSDNHSSVDLIFKSTREDLKIWPRSFELRLRITLSAGKVVLILRVRNTDNKPFSFSPALCNYLRVSDISEVRIEGLETLDYLDNLVNRTRFTEQADAVTFDGEVDRTYLCTPYKIAIIDHEKKRTFELKKIGMGDTVVWNPWKRKAKAINDMGDEDYESMICLSCAAIENPVVLKQGEEWKGYQELSTVSSSYCSGQLDPRKVIYGFH